MSRLCLAIGLACLTVSTAASAAPSARPFHDLTPATASALVAGNPHREAPLPARFRTLEVDGAALAALLARAPLERSHAEAPLVLTLPYPDGSDRRFRVEESPILEPGLARRFPRIRTFVAQGIDDPGATARLSSSASGFHAMVLSSRGTVFIDPYRRGDDRYAISYWKHDARSAGPPTRCVVHGGLHEKVNAATAHLAMAPLAIAPPSATASTAQLRTYRLAIAATAEYTAAVCAPDPAAASCGLDAITVTVNRVDAIYERELAIRLELVSDDDAVIYTDPATDPYDNDDAGLLLQEVQQDLDDHIHSESYDVGQVFATVDVGLASLGVACNSIVKGSGVSGAPQPSGDAFDVDIVAHELGHQLGANHTFNGTTGGCDGNRNESTAYEPGSGSTIMSYAGNCGAENLQAHSDDVFHTTSRDEILAYTTAGKGGTCAVETDTGNTPPTVDAGASFTVPKQTPFTLSGAGSDVDGTASLTYSWEEVDLGAAAPPNDDTDAERPIFRSFVPTTIPSRTFPRLADILANTATPGESMSTRDRTLHFRLTARDNQAGGGGVSYASTTVTVAAAAGPFTVTQPNTAVSWGGGTTQTVTWDVAGTDAAPVSCADVTIDLSTDGGNTFATPLLASTPNDGAESVTLPAVTTSRARVRVRCVGNVFFDVSDADFSIVTAGAAPDLQSVSPTTGNTLGGEAVTLTGSGFVNGATVRFGEVSSPAVTFQSATTLIATSPAHAAGAVDVTVTNPDAQSDTLASAFLYVASLLPFDDGFESGTLDGWDGSTTP